MKVKEMKLKEYQERKKILDKIRISNRVGSHINCIRICNQNSYLHEKTKFDICYTLSKYGYEFFTEAILTNNIKVDILAIKNGKGTVIEIEQNLNAIKRKIAREKKLDGLKIVYIDLEKFNLQRFEQELI